MSDVVLRSARLGWSTRVDGRAVAVTVVALAAAFAVLCWSTATGDFPVPISDVLATMVGRGSEEAAFVVRTLRLPRGLTGFLVGAAFGLSGAIFQRVTRNPLASPDFVGVNGGAAVAAVFVIVVLHGSTTMVTLGSVVGALGATAAIYLLAYQRGVSGYRLVLVGVGVAAACTSTTSFLLTRAELFDAQRATVWLTGSLSARSWDHVRADAVALAVLVPAAIVLARRLRVLELGDEVAVALGERVELTRGLLVLVAALLAAVATSTAGPVAFVALISPQIARLLVGGRGAALLPAAACGAVLVVAADFAGRRVFAPTELPVGIVTSIIGAPYLLFLLARANRIGAGG